MKQLIKLFYNDPNNSYSIRSLAQQLNKAYSYVYGQVNTLAEKGVLKKRKVGAAIYCSLNYGSDGLLKWLVQIEGDNLEEFLKIEKRLSKPLRELIDRLPERTNFNLQSAVLFGSYAKGHAIPKSDLDLFFILSLKDQYRELIESEILSLSRRYRIKINPVLAEPMEFLKMVRAKEPNLAHEIMRNKIILYGREKFWELVSTGLR